MVMIIPQLLEVTKTTCIQQLTVVLNGNLFCILLIFNKYFSNKQIIILKLLSNFSLQCTRISEVFCILYECLTSNGYLLILFIDHTQNGTQDIYTIHMEYKHVHTKHIYRYIRVNQLQSIEVK